MDSKLSLRRRLKSIAIEEAGVISLLFEEELRRTESLLEEQIQSLERAAQSLWQQVQQDRLRDEPKIKEFLDQCRLTLISVAEYAAVFRNAAHGMDLKDKSAALTAIVEQHFLASPWVACHYSPILLCIHDILWMSPESSRSEAAWDDTTVPVQQFERVTRKYWIKEETNLPITILSCLEEAPLLVQGTNQWIGRFNSDCAKADTNDDSVDVLWDQCATQISTVYFDSPQFQIYHDRVRRWEGAQLLRARWYGTKPQRNQPVFLELKTHRPSWTNRRSSKERVAILEKDMAAFLYPTSPWTVQQAQEILQRASPHLSKDRLYPAVQLLLRMHALVWREKLRPCIRTSFRRFAFQLAENSKLRITLDCNIVVTDESPVSGGQWSLSDEDFRTLPGIHHALPHAVLEVKLDNDKTLPSLEELRRKDILTDAFEFSKYLDGVATLHCTNRSWKARL